MLKMASIDKVRIIVVGDSGVGKTCLTHLIAYNECLTRPGWTVGCNVEVKLHNYKEGTPQQQPFFIEFLDIGGSLNHKNTRSVFYTPTHGIILVHDLTNRKSHDNLREWLFEILNKDGKDTNKSCSTANVLHGDSRTFDPEQFLGSTQTPILVVGTKLDLIDDRRQPKSVQKTGGIAELCSAEEIWLNCHNPRGLATGTTDDVKLARFFDRVIEKRTCAHLHHRDVGLQSGIDRRKYQTPSPHTSFESSLLFNSPTLSDHRTSTPNGNVLIDANSIQ